jgi:8-oxo-dGTP pyrophosphatase MutT (NUDIX family)
MVREKSCGVVLFRRTREGPKFLLLHYKSGHWDFPKGHVEKDEDERRTAARELEEETGISKIRFVEGFRDLVKYFFRRGKKTVYKEVIFFLVETEEEKVTISYEHIGYKWLNYEDAMRQLTFKNAQGILEKSMKFVPKHQA